jgi:hypothetical protein
MSVQLTWQFANQFGKAAQVPFVQIKRIIELVVWPHILLDQMLPDWRERRELNLIELY